MKILTRVFLLVTGLLLLGHYLPEGYWLLAAKAQRAPMVFYSCVEKRFLFYRYTGQGVDMVDMQGRKYTREDFERLLPLDNYMQLLRDGKLPDSIDGVEIVPERLRRERLNYKIKPVSLDSPVAALYPLLDADNGRVRLEMPNDYMRIGSRVEFIDAETNKVSVEKSGRFQKAFETAGFVFPPRFVGGNPTTLKAFDDGYFLVDAKGTSFHLRQVRGESELTRLSDVAPAEDKALWQSLRPRYIHVQEQNPEEIRVIVINEDNRVYLALGKQFRLVEVPLQHFDPTTSSFVLRGDLLNRLITVVDDSSLEVVVLDRGYKLVDRYTEKLPQRAESPAGRLARTIFPFTVAFDDDNSAYMGLHLEHGRLTALGINALFLAVGAVWFWSRRQLSLKRLPDLAALAIGGLYGLILVLWTPRAE
jgi:hypothetical protein